MYLYDSPASFSRSQNLSLSGTFSRFGDPPAPSPDLILDDFDFGILPEQPADPLARGRLVVDDHRADPLRLTRDLEGASCHRLDLRVRVLQPAPRKRIPRNCK